MVEASLDISAKELKRNHKKVLEDIVSVITCGKYEAYTITVSDKDDLRVYKFAEGTVILKDYTKKYNAIRLWAIGLGKQLVESLFLDLEKVIEPYLTEKEIEARSRRISQHMPGR